MHSREDAQKGLDIEIICGQDDLEKHLLINSDKLLVPFPNIGRSFSVFVRVRFVPGRLWFTTVVLAVLQNLRDR